MTPAEERAAILRKVAFAAVADARAAWRKARALATEANVRAAYRQCILAARALRRASEVWPEDEDAMIEESILLDEAATGLKIQLVSLVEGVSAEVVRSALFSRRA